MYVLDYRQAIKESAEWLEKLRNQQQKALYYRRVHFLYLLKSGSCLSQGAAGQQIGLKVRGAQKLFKRYRAAGLPGLLTPSAHMGRPAKLDAQSKATLQAALSTDSIQTLKQGCDFIATTIGIEMSQVAMHYYFKALGIKKKTGRPSSVRKDLEGEKTFKKKSFRR